MKKTIKGCSILLLALIMSISILPTNADAVGTDKGFTCKKTEESNKIELNKGTEFEVSTLTLGETQSKEVILSNGETGVMSVTKIADFDDDIDEPSIVTYGWSHWHTRKNVTNGTYKVSVITAAANAGFKIDVRNYNITAAYDPWHFMVISNVSGNLTHDSSKKATYFMNFNMSIPWVGGPSWTGGVQARIEGKNLVTYWD